MLLRPVVAEDADGLFPLVYQTGVADTLLWDGPASLNEYRLGLAGRESRAWRGETHLFTMIADGQPIGAIDIRPENDSRADIGLWIGKPFHGKGYGSQAVRWIVSYGFEYLGLEKIEAEIFVGNWGSRRIFEKNGFLLEGTRRKSVRKYGQVLDEWLMGLTREDWAAREAGMEMIVHLCPREDWEAAQASGAYRAKSLDEMGFIHFSRPGQVRRVANNFYRGVPGLVLLWVDVSQLNAELRYEASKYEADSGESFPHLYGALNLGAVAAVSVWAIG